MSPSWSVWEFCGKSLIENAHRRILAVRESSQRPESGSIKPGWCSKKWDTHSSTCECEIYAKKMLACLKIILTGRSVLSPFYTKKWLKSVKYFVPETQKCLYLQSKTGKSSVALKRMHKRTQLVWSSAVHPVGNQPKTPRSRCSSHIRRIYFLVCYS